VQVANDVGAHCVVAEASVRINHLEEAVTKLKHDDLLTQVRGGMCVYLEKIPREAYILPWIWSSAGGWQ